MGQVKRELEAKNEREKSEFSVKIKLGEWLLKVVEDKAKAEKTSFEMAFDRIQVLLTGDIPKIKIK